MPEPQPRRDDKNVPWCSGYQEDNKPACWDDCDEFLENPYCLPAIEADQERLKALEKYNRLQDAEIKRLERVVRNGNIPGPPDPPRPLIRRDFG